SLRKEEAVLSDPLAPRSSPFPARAKRLIFLFMNGGPSHVDTFDPKPGLKEHEGEEVPAALAAKSMRKAKGKLMPSPFAFAPYGESGIEVSELYPHVGSCMDDLCVLRS